MSTANRIVTRYLPVALATATVAACGGGGGSSNDGKPTTGSMKLSVTDAPVDSAEAVWVQFRAVQFKPEGVAPVRQELKDAQGVAAPQRINLLPLQDGRTSVLLDGVRLPAGNYEWLRLLVDNESNVRDMLSASRCLDGSDVDLVHRHHRLEGTFRLIATSRKRVGQHARRDLP